MNEWTNDLVLYCEDCDITFKVYVKGDEINTGFCPGCGTRNITGVEEDEE